MNDELTKEVYSEELKQCEKAYYKHLYKKTMVPTVQFHYARCLVRSKYPADIKKGILFLEELCKTDPEGQPDYFYFLAIGYARIKEYGKALKHVSSAIDLEPHNPQIPKLHKLIKARMDREGLITMGLASGVIILLGLLTIIVIKLKNL